MSDKPGKVRNDHPLNMFISSELKKSLEDLAERHDRTVAAIVRLLLTIAIPIADAIWGAETAVLRESAKWLRRKRDAGE